jgi:hypothetical protein
MDYGLVLLILVFIEGIIILGGLRELSNQIEAGLDDLDMNMAEAIKTVVENLADNMGFSEPINPFQQVLAQFLQQSLAEKQNPGIIEVGRGENGQFLKKE